MEKKIEEMARDIQEATRRASNILGEETIKFVEQYHHYHSVNDFDKAHTKTLAEREAEYLVEQGYRKQVQGVWEVVLGSNGKEKMVCTNCRHGQDLASTFVYCPNCGARMKGAER